MSKKAKILAASAFALAAALVVGAPTNGWAAGGLISIIVIDPANPYWLTEGNVAAAEAKKLGYEATVGASKSDTNTESKLIDTAITNKSVAIILDPADASGSIGAVKKAIAANIPVFLVNAEINQEGLAKAQLVSNNAQGAALGAQQWVKDIGQKGNYVELLGAPSDNNAATRSNGYETVLSQYEGLKKVASQVANWDRTPGPRQDAEHAAGPSRHHGRDQRQRRDGARRDRGAEGGRQAVQHQGGRFRRVARRCRGDQGGRTAI